MTTLRQIEANRRNAALSTGPRTEQGRAASSRNALKHGLSGAGVVRTEEEAAHVEAVLQEWKDFYRPADAHEEFHVEQAVLMSVRLRRCCRHDWALRLIAVERAGACWDEDRRRAAAELGAKLAKDPALYGRRLRRTRQGCEWLLERWEGLAGMLRDGRDWTEAQRAWRWTCSARRRRCATGRRGSTRRGWRGTPSARRGWRWPRRRSRPWSGFATSRWRAWTSWSGSRRCSASPPSSSARPCS